MENTSNSKEIFMELYERMYNLCMKEGWGNPHNYGRGSEIYLSLLLNHQIADTYSGADAIDECGECEYKTTINKSINGTYNGISVQPTWQEQLTYLTEKKIGVYGNHYFARFENGTASEVWKLSGKNVLDILSPKLEKDWNRKIQGRHKDPRLSSSITKTEIYRYGTKIYGN